MTVSKQDQELKAQSTRPTRPGRPAQIIPSVSRHVRFQAPLMAELELHLFSGVEGKVPYGALSEFVGQACRELLDRVYGKQAKGMRHVPGRDLPGGDPE